MNPIHYILFRSPCIAVERITRSEEDCLSSSFFTFLSSCHKSNFCNCKNGKQHKTCSKALCTMDDASYFHDIRLGPKTSVYHMKVIVVSSGCDVTNCATTLQGFNKHASSHREAVSDSRRVPRCTEKIFKNLRLLTCVNHLTRPIHHTRIQ